MNILIVGFGSIGQRHLQNLQKLCPDARFWVLKKSSKHHVIKDCEIIHENIYTYYSNVEFITSLESSVVTFDCAFICNNSSEHLDYATRLAEMGVDLFIEKPLATSSKGVDRLQQIVHENSLVAAVGFQTKYSDIYLKLKNIIETSKVPPNHVFSRWLTFLPDWHPYEDYKQSYAAKKNLGGGVAATLLHELDMLYTLLPNLELANFVSGNFTSIGIEADDYLSINLISNNMPVHLSLSFGQTSEQRKIEIAFPDKFVEADFIKNQLKVIFRDGTQSVLRFNQQRNQLFELEIIDFLNSIKTRQNDVNSLLNSKNTLRIIDEILQ